MKNILTFSAVFAFVAIPATLALDVVGLHLPAQFGPGNAFGLFVISFTILTAVADYARAARPRPVRALAETKSAHPLAA